LLGLPNRFLCEKACIQTYWNRFRKTRTSAQVQRIFIGRIAIILSLGCRNCTIFNFGKLLKKLLKK